MLVAQIEYCRRKFDVFLNNGTAQRQIRTTEEIAQEDIPRMIISKLFLSSRVLLVYVREAQAIRMLLDLPAIALL